MRKLAPHQVIILQYLADGLTYKQIARKFQTTYQVINNYMRWIRLDLEADSTIHAVAIAFRRGLIK